MLGRCALFCILLSRHLAFNINPFPVSIVSLTAYLEGRPLHLVQQHLWAQHVHVGGSKPGHKLWPKVDGGLTTGACWAPRRFTGMAALSHCTLGLSLGACMGLEGCTYMEAWHWQPMGGQKWMGAMRQECTEPHGQFTRTDDFIARCYLNWDPHRRHRGRQHARIILVVAWQNWTVCRSWRIDLTGPHQLVESERQATCWHFISTLQQRPYVLFSDSC